MDHDDIQAHTDNMVDAVANIEHDNDVIPAVLTVDDSSELQVVDSLEAHVEDTDDNDVFDDLTIDIQGDPVIDGVSATTAVTQTTKQETTAQDMAN